MTDSGLTPIMYQDLANPFMGRMDVPANIGYDMGVAGLASAGMVGGAGAMGMPGAMSPQTSYLNGVKMKEQPKEDEYFKVKEEKAEGDKKLLKTALLIFAGCVALGFISPLRKALTPKEGFGKFFSNKWHSVTDWTKNKCSAFSNWTKNLFKKK
ncbi:hypothetical protein J6E39_09970 [bacterium]|nr:hypothetical protein [bacterium]